MGKLYFKQPVTDKFSYKKIFLTWMSFFFLLMHIQPPLTDAGYPAGAETDELKQIKQFEAFVKREGDTLYLKLKTGAFISLKNSGKCSGWDSCKEYEFIDYFKDAGFYHVFLYLGEQSEHLMLSDKTGQEYEVHSAPELSPDGNRLAAVSASEAFDVNGVFIWRLDGDGLVQELLYEPEEYALYGFKAWLDNKTIRLSKFTRSKKNICPSSDFMTVPVVLKLKEGVWRFYEDPSSPAVRCGEE